MLQLETRSEPEVHKTERFDVIVVGAGISGVGAAVTELYSSNWIGSDQGGGLP